MERTWGKDDGSVGSMDAREGHPAHGDEGIADLMHISMFHHEDVAEDERARNDGDHEEGLHWIHIMQ